jgi:acylphosphatase
MNLVTVHAFVSGKVQGVYYRDTVRRKALAQAMRLAAGLEICQMAESK